MVEAAVDFVTVQLIGTLGAGMMLSSGGFSHTIHTQWDSLAGIGVKDALVFPFGALHPDIFTELRAFLDKEWGWRFFHVSYDVKNVIENLHSANPDRIRFPELVIFRPLLVVGRMHGQYYAEGDMALFKELEEKAEAHMITRPEDNRIGIRVHHAVTQAQYIAAVEAIRKHIRLGDIYEMNYCQEFYAELPVGLDPVMIWTYLANTSPAPFSAYYRWKEHLLISSSPERFMCRRGQEVISQPMKGTIRRGMPAEEDLRLKEHLLADVKERAENVMIVDLVRNDLSRIAERASVKVEELFGVYTFPEVHQMISTISARIREQIILPDVLRAAFPMGSMTGAPKIRAMELIEQYESSRRGLFSGSVGYITPSGDFDMNVIIRSIIVNLADRILSFQTGGAITAASDPVAEYNESLLKAAGMLRALRL